MTTTTTTARKQYTNWVAYFNARLAETFGAKQFVLTRGAGYYYFRGEALLAYRVPSIYVWKLDLRADRAFVEAELSDAVSFINANR